MFNWTPTSWKGFNLKKIIQLVTVISLVVGVIYTLILIFSPKQKDPQQNSTVIKNNSINTPGNGNIYIINSPNSKLLTNINTNGPDSLNKKRQIPKSKAPSKSIKTITKEKSGKTTIAILPFENISNSQEYSWLSKGIAESLIKYITEVDSIELVEGNLREKILSEINFQQGKYVDEKSAVQIGRLVGAKQVIIGSYQVYNNEVDITCRIVDVESGKIEKMCLIQHSGFINTILQVEKDFAQKVLNCLRKG